jgi:hypothetical protein
MAMPIKYLPFSLLLPFLLLALTLSSGCTKNPEAPVVTSPSALPDFEDIAPDGSTTLSNLPGGQNNVIPNNPLIPISNGNFVATLTSFGVRMTNQELQSLKKRVAVKPNGKWSRTVSQNADQALQANFKRFGALFNPPIEDAEAYKTQALAFAERTDVPFYLDVQFYLDKNQFLVNKWDKDTQEFISIQPDGTVINYLISSAIKSPRYVEIDL